MDSTCQRLLKLCLVLVAASAVLLPGCSSDQASRDVGAISGLDYGSGVSARQQKRSKSMAEKVNPGYKRYLVRLAERRKSLGLPAPAELRVATRRDRYMDVFDVLTATKSVLEQVTNPVTRHIPFIGPAQPGTALTTTTATNPKEVSSTARSVSSLLFKPIDPATYTDDL